MKKFGSRGCLLLCLVITLGLLFFTLRYTMNKDTGTGPQNSRSTAREVSSSSLVGYSQQADSQDDPAARMGTPPERRRMIGIKAVAAALTPMKKVVKMAGRVEADERRVKTVNVKVEGWVDTLYADYAGKYVTRGMPLAEIYSPELISLQLQYLKALKWRTSVLSRYERNIEFSLGDPVNEAGRLTFTDIAALIDTTRQKLFLWGMSEEQVREIEAATRPIRTLTVRSPIAGYIVQKPAVQGAKVSPGDRLFEIIDLSVVWVLADLHENELPFIKPGQEAKITLSNRPDKIFISRVDYIYPALSGLTKTARARFIVPNPDASLKPQMFGNVEMELDLGEKLAIPETAILDTGTRQIVYADLGQGRFTPRAVKTGTRVKGFAEVLSGLRPGDRVASTAAFLIDSESKVKDIEGE